MTGVLWSLHNERTSRQVDQLSFEQVEFILELIPQADRSAWLVWRTGLADWINLSDCQDFTVTSDAEKYPQPPAVVSSTSQPKIPKESVVEEPRESEIESYVENRLNQRLALHFAVEILSPNGNFKTLTEDISTSGLRVRDAIPESLGKHIVLLVKRPNGVQIKLFCQPIRAPNATENKSYRLRILGGEKEGLLRAWLLEAAAAR